MVTKRELANRIENLEQENKKLKQETNRLYASLKAFNKRILALEGKNKEEVKDLIGDWLQDDRVEAVQGFIKGGK